MLQQESCHVGQSALRSRSGTTPPVDSFVALLPRRGSVASLSLSPPPQYPVGKHADFGLCANSNMAYSTQLCRPSGVAFLERLLLAALSAAEASFVKMSSRRLYPRGHARRSR